MSGDAAAGISLLSHSLAVSKRSRSLGSPRPQNAQRERRVVLLANDKHKWRDLVTRGIMGLLMMASMTLFVLAGHLCVVLGVAAMQLLVFKEVISLAYTKSKERQLPWFRTTMWYFLVTMIYFLYGETLMHHFTRYFLVDAFWSPLARHHRLVSFLMYTSGIVVFVLNLKKGHYKFQFSQFGITHMTLLLVVVQSQFVISNIFEGLFWYRIPLTSFARFILPVLIVVCNDVMAYAFGMCFGRTPLIKLSPKKTWEGFIGAFAATMVFAFFVSGAFAKIPYLICPVNDHVFSNFLSHADCDPNPVFVFQKLRVFPAARALVYHLAGRRPIEVYIAPVQWHSLVLAAFGSIIAPFGGFFASGFKRAFKVKDFSESIPGHGGITDRMDCQFLMIFFSHLYYSSFIALRPLNVNELLALIIEKLDVPRQIELHDSLREYLLGQDLIKE